MGVAGLARVVDALTLPMRQSELLGSFSLQAQPPPFTSSDPFSHHLFPTTTNFSFISRILTFWRHLKRVVNFAKLSDFDRERHESSWYVFQSCSSFAVNVRIVLSQSRLFVSSSCEANASLGQLAEMSTLKMDRDQSSVVCALLVISPYPSCSCLANHLWRILPTTRSIMDLQFAQFSQCTTKQRYSNSTLHVRPVPPCTPGSRKLTKPFCVSLSRCHL